MATPSIDITLAMVRAEQAKRRLSEFARQAWHVIEPGTQYLHNWHVDAICEHLECVTSGESTRLLINIPPRYMKSRLVSVFWPCWEWIHRPELRYMFATYSAGLSTEHSIDRRAILTSDWYVNNWGHIIQLVQDQNVKTEYRNTRQGVMVATSVGGTALGKGGNRIVVDDPHNTQQAESEAERLNTLNQFDRALSTRLNDKKRDAIVVVMQRLHEKDISARCLELGYTHLCLPAEAERKTLVILPRTKTEIVREPGDLLWPEREGPAEIAIAKAALGPYGYAGQYQQRPAPAEGGLIKRVWWRYWQPKDVDLGPVDVDGKVITPVTLPEEFDQQFDSWDATFKDAADSDFVVGGEWARAGADCYLLDRDRARRDFPSTLSAIRTMRMKWKHSRATLIEDTANGPALIATLRHEIMGVLAVRVKGSKDARLQAVLPIIAAGNVYLPHPRLYPWVREYVDWMAVFPNGEFDDDVDMTSQALQAMQPGVWSEIWRDHRDAMENGAPPKTAEEAHARQVHKEIMQRIKANEQAKRRPAVGGGYL